MAIQAVIPVFLAALAAGPSSEGADATPAAKPALPATIAFDSALAKSEARIALADVAADFPRNWSGYEALVLELRASSPQRVHLRIFTRSAGGERLSRVLFHPY